MLVPIETVDEYEFQQRVIHLRRATYGRQFNDLAFRLDKQGERLRREEKAQKRRDFDAYALWATQSSEWRPIPHMGGYDVSDNGFVRFSTSKQIVQPIVSPHGYLTVSIPLADRRVKRLHVHRAVAMAFLPNPQKLPQVNHIDLDRSNSHVSNLEWVSVSRNQSHTKLLAINAFDRCAALVRAHSLDYPDNPRVVEALELCVEKIQAMGRSVRESVGGDHYSLGIERLERRLQKRGGVK